MEKVIASLFLRVAEILRDDPRVLYPGSLRSYIYAVSDVTARLSLGVDDPENVIVRIGVQNLVNSVKAAVPHDEKKRIIEDAIRKALHEERRAPQKDRYYGSHGLADRPNQHKVSHHERVRAHKSSRSGEIVRGVLYAGDSGFANLATLINAVVGPMAHIRQKLEALYTVREELHKAGLISREEVEYPSLRLDVSKRSVVAEQASTIKVSTHSTSNMPISIVSVDHYRPGSPLSAVDLLRTSANVSRKNMLGRPIEDRDIIINVYGSADVSDIVVALDVSGSMKEYSRGMSKIGISKKAIRGFIEYLAATGDRLSLILFNYRADILWTLFPVYRYKREMVELLRYIYAGGGTNIGEALAKSADVFKASRAVQKHLILITDGRTINADVAVNRARTLFRTGVTISAISIGQGSDDDLLKRIVRHGSGTFVKISSIFDLERALKIGASRRYM